MSDVGHECGLMGIFGMPEAAAQVWLGLHAQQHRGQEGAGIVASDGQEIRSLKGLGLLERAIPPDDLPRLPGHLAIGHVRYPASGSNRIQNVQPIVVNYSEGLIALAHNGGIVNARALRDEYEAWGSIFQTSTDSEVIVHLLAKPSHVAKPNNLGHCLNHLKGAYCFLFLREDRIVAARDPQGIRPLVLGRFPQGGWAVASETVAFDVVGADYVREIDPGEMVTLSAAGLESHRFAPPADIRPAHCIFEHVYFARPDSQVFGENVHWVRMRLGRAIARESAVDADIVAAIPDSGTSAAIGYCHESGIPFDRALIRNHYVGRSFIAPEQEARRRAVSLKLNVVPAVVRGKRIVLVDDSLVRGTTVRNLIRMIRGAGAKEVHLRLSCPPNLYPCYYGTDFPSRAELIAANHTQDEIRQFVGADSLAYLSLEGMLSAVGRPADQYCAACFTGTYPVPPMDDFAPRKDTMRFAHPLETHAGEDLLNRNLDTQRR